MANTKMTKYGFDIEALKTSNGKCKIRVDLPGNDITFETEFRSEGEGLQFALDFIEDLKGMFKPYIIMEVESIKETMSDTAN